MKQGGITVNFHDAKRHKQGDPRTLLRKYGVTQNRSLATQNSKPNKKPPDAREGSGAKLSATPDALPLRSPENAFPARKGYRGKTGCGSITIKAKEEGIQGEKNSKDPSTNEREADERKRAGNVAKRGLIFEVNISDGVYSNLE